MTYSLTYLLTAVWLLQALAVALDARRHGEHPLLWGAVAALIPLFGALAWLVVRGRRPQSVV